jgi:pyruvate/2-oxoglutarate dehydrogenase complex dihydrolipoamide dehydrogenase (E3) component
VDSETFERIDAQGQQRWLETLLTVRTLSGEHQIEGSDILVAVGRIRNTTGIGLTEAGVALDDRGYVRVNERLETAPGVWVMGECAGSPQFTHASVDDFRIIRDNLAEGRAARAIAWCRTACSQTRHSPMLG